MIWSQRACFLLPEPFLHRPSRATELFPGRDDHPDKLAFLYPVPFPRNACRGAKRIPGAAPGVDGSSYDFSAIQTASEGDSCSLAARLIRSPLAAMDTSAGLTIALRQHRICATSSDILEYKECLMSLTMQRAHSPRA